MIPLALGSQVRSGVFMYEDQMYLGWLLDKIEAAEAPVTAIDAVRFYGSSVVLEPRERTWDLLTSPTTGVSHLWMSESRIKTLVRRIRELAS